MKSEKKEIKLHRSGGENFRCWMRLSAAAASTAGSTSSTTVSIGMGRVLIFSAAAAGAGEYNCCDDRNRKHHRPKYQNWGSDRQSSAVEISQYPHHLRVNV